jgi:hypothetical protein
MSRFAERMASDLHQIADRATPSSTAWDSIRTRIDEQTDEPDMEVIMLAPDDSKATKRTWVTAGAVAVAAAVLVIIGIVALTGGEDATDTVTDPDVKSTTTTSTPAVEPGPVSDFEDIAGTYLRQTPGDPQFLHFFEDGSFHGSNNVDLVVDRPAWIFETRFEGTNVLVTSTDHGCGDDPDAIYEIQLLESSNLQLVAIEDPCPPRSSYLQGASLRITGQAAEWEPVP